MCRCGVLLACLYCGLFVVLAALPLATAQPLERDNSSTGASGLPLPRFVSLSVSEAYMRTGPGQRFPILWIYRRNGLPFEITAEYGPWRRVRESDGTEGWMHARLLSGSRTGIITGGMQISRFEPAETAPPVLRLEPGVVGEIIECRDDDWCQLKVGGRKGWLRRDQFWGTYRSEIIE